MLKIAIQGKHSALVSTPQGMTMTATKAIAAGFTIARDAAHANEIRAHAGLATADTGSSYLDRILALPEAKERPAAAAQYAAAWSSKPRPLAHAALFLSGLASELDAEVQPVAEAISPALDAMLARRCEIHLIGLDRRALQGDRTAKTDAIAIRYGLDLYRSSRMHTVHALKQAGVDFGRLREALNKMGS